MDDTDTATIELSKAEAREVINALSEYRTRTSGRDEERALNVEELLQREFGFEQRHFEEDNNPLEVFANVFADRDEDHEVELSRVEAAEVDSALAEADRSSRDEAETVEDLRDRFQGTFDLESGSRA